MARTTRRAHARKGTRGVRRHALRIRPPTRGEWDERELKAYLEGARAAQREGNEMALRNFRIGMPQPSGGDEVDLMLLTAPTRAELRRERQA